MSQTSSSFDLKVVLRDTLMVGLVSLILFGPIVGIVLDGYGYNLEPGRVGIMVAVVMAGRFLLSLFGVNFQAGSWIAQGAAGLIGAVILIWIVRAVRGV